MQIRAVGDRQPAWVMRSTKKGGAGAGTHDAQKTPAKAGKANDLSMRHEAMKRQAATQKGLDRRFKDLLLERVPDPRTPGNVVHSMQAILYAVIFAVVSGTQTLRGVEDRTEQLRPKAKKKMGIAEKIADNTIGNVLPRVSPEALRPCLVRLVKAEHRRGVLKPTVLPIGTVAIDGKNLGTLRWHDMCRVLNLEPDEATPQQVKNLMAEAYPIAQFCQPKKGKPYALVRAHTVTLTSSDSAVCVYQRAILGNTNEIGSMPALIGELFETYGKTSLFRMITTDAGNTSLAAADAIIACDRNYFLQIKSEHGHLYHHAVRVLGEMAGTPPGWFWQERQKGKNVTYRVWQYDLSKQPRRDWNHTRQFVRVERTVEDPATGQSIVGNRYYVTDQTTQELPAKACGKNSRAHWRCENETHWTADAEIEEDQRRLTLSRHPVGIFVASLLRRIAVNILAVARRMSRLGDREETPSWRQVCEHFLLEYCRSILNTEAFDADIS